MYRHLLEKLVRTPLDDVVVSEGVLDRTGLEAAHAEQDQSGKLLSDVLLDAETIDEWDLAKLVARSYALPFVDVRMCSIPSPVMELLPLDWCRERSILPFDQFGKSIDLACVEVPTAELVEEITNKTGCMPFIFVTLRRSLRDAIDEQVKRGPRSLPRPASTASVTAVPAATPAAQVPAAAAATPAAAVAASAAPTTDPIAAGPARKRRVVPADLPRVSLRLDASAASVAHAKSGHHRGATLAPQAGPVLLGASSKSGPAVLGGAPKTGSISEDPNPAGPPAVLTGASVVGSARKVSPISHLLSQPEAPASAAAAGEPQRPKLASRVAPVLPPPGTPKVRGPGSDAKSSPAPEKGAPAPAPKQGKDKAAWESIFDSGDQAVRKTTL